VLLVPLFAAFDTLLGDVGSDIGRHLLATAWRHLPASLVWEKNDHLISSGMLGGSAA
jgi:hypothetical protein